METGGEWTRVLETLLIGESKQLENIFFQNYHYTAWELADKISFLEESITDTTPALLRANKLHETIKRILDIRDDDSKRTSTGTKNKEITSKRPEARRRVGHKVPAHDSPHLGTIPKDQATQQTRIFLFRFRARFAALLNEYQKIMDHEVPEPTCELKDPVPVTLAETISEAIAAGRVKIIVTGKGKKEGLSESESRCHCSS